MNKRRFLSSKKRRLFQTQKRRKYTEAVLGLKACRSGHFVTVEEAAKNE